LEGEKRSPAGAEISARARDLLFYIASRLQLLRRFGFSAAPDRRNKIFTFGEQIFLATFALIAIICSALRERLSLS
jgi:hypothetical protein